MSFSSEICLTCLFIHTFIGGDFTHLLGKLFHRLMTVGKENVFALVSVHLTFCNTDMLFLTDRKKKDCFSFYSLLYMTDMLKTVAMFSLIFLLSRVSHPCSVTFLKPFFSKT